MRGDVQGCAPAGRALPRVMVGAEVLSGSILGRKPLEIRLCKRKALPASSRKGSGCRRLFSVVDICPWDDFPLKVEHQVQACPLEGSSGTQAPAPAPSPFWDGGIYRCAPSSPRSAPLPSPSLLIQSLPGEMGQAGPPSRPPQPPRD